MILTEDELVRWGRRVGEALQAPVFVGLRGPLGAGKSVLARAIAAGAGVEASMPSPTFNLVFRYRAADGVKVVHMDLYRVEEPAELRELGWEELLVEREIVLVEWPERAGHLLPDDRWEVRLDLPRPDEELEGPREAYRRVSVRRFGNPPHLPAFPFGVTR